MKRASQFLATAALALFPVSLPRVCTAQSEAAPTVSAASAAPSTAAAAAPEAKPAAGDDLSQFKTADALWKYISDWANKEPDIDKTLDDAAREQKIAEFVDGERVRLMPASTEFLKRYPEDARRWDVKLVQLSLIQEGDAPEVATMEKTLQEIAAAPDASVDAKTKSRQALLGLHLQQGVGEDGLTPAMESEIAAFERDFPDSPDGGQFVSLRLHFLGENPAPEAVNALLTRLSKSPNKATAATAQAQLSLRTEPLDLKFTAVDGREVDLSKLRGKVVLVDFWATWCPECLQQAGSVVTAFRKYHDKGFEIVGISLDQEKESMEKFSKAVGMTWPQYFDGKFWQTDIARRFGIDKLPAMWLLDTDGRVTDFQPSDDLDAAVANLLAGNKLSAPAAGMASAGSGTSVPASQP